jgi:hypothetical protein
VEIVRKEFEVTKLDCRHVYLCMFIYLYVPCVVQVYYFVCIYSFKYLYMGRDVLVYANVRNIIYHMYSSIIVCISIYASICIRVFIVRFSVKF